MLEDDRALNPTGTNSVIPHPIIFITFIDFFAHFSSFLKKVDPEMAKYRRFWPFWASYIGI